MRQLPDKALTSDPEEFENEWSEWFKPFENSGFRVRGFTPFVRVSYTLEGAHGQMSWGVAEKIRQMRRALDSKEDR